MKRRTVLKSFLVGASAFALTDAVAFTDVAPDADNPCAALERKYGGRLGVSVLDTATGRRIAHRGDERFLMCSTFKLLAVAAVLARVDAGREQLNRRVIFGKQALLAYAPVTGMHVGGPGMSVSDLCRAAITVSDNTAANLLLASMGGPAAVTRFVRQLGDRVTRLDRIEPELNVGSPGDLRDTTTPDAMLATMQKVLLGHHLSDSSRGFLVDWLRACSTGVDQLRATLGGTWTAGDKTGSGAHGETNDVAIIWPPQRKPLLVTAYYDDSPASVADRHAVLAEVGRIAASI